MAHSVLKVLFSPNPSSQGSRNYVKEEAKGILTGKGDVGLQGNTTIQPQQDSHMIANTVATYTKLAQVQDRQGPSTERGK